MKKMPRILFVGIFLFRTLRLSYIDTFKTTSSGFFMSREHWHLFQQFQNKRYGMAPTFNEWETTLSDHILLRNTMLKFYTKGSLLLGRPVVNDVVIQKEKLLTFYGYSYWNLDYLSDQAKTVVQSYGKLNDVVNSYGGISFMLECPSSLHISQNTIRNIWIVDSGIQRRFVQSSLLQWKRQAFLS